MNKKIPKIATLMFVVSLISVPTFFATESDSMTKASGNNTVGKTVEFQNSQCPDYLNNKHKTITVEGGTMKYGCYNAPGTKRDKPFTEYSKDTTADYQAFTTTPSGSTYGTIKDRQHWSTHSERTMTSGGSVKYSVRLYD